MSQENTHGYRIPFEASRATKQHRTLDEMFFLRFPALYRRAAYLWSRLPKESRLRRWLLVRAIGLGMSAANRRDFDVLMLGLDPAIDYRNVSGPRGAVPPDVIGHHYGHAGYRELWRTMMEGFEDLTLEPQELLDLGDKVVAVTRLRGHGTGSGIPLDNQFLFQVWSFHRGLVVKQEDFGSREEALEAVGLRE
jgi:ketosteroid isomerase-like protein